VRNAATIGGASLIATAQNYLEQTCTIGIWINLRTSWLNPVFGRKLAKIAHDSIRR
jgi:hypothetical protein